MLSESARATTTAESRFRIDGPNSRARRVSVIALDAPSERIAAELATRPWGNARFRRAPELDDAAALIDEVAGADLVGFIARVGHDASGAAAIGELCRLSRVATMSLVVTSPADTGAGTARTLAQLRPYSDMLVVTSAADCIADLLTALRA